MCNCNSCLSRLVLSRLCQCSCLVLPWYADIEEEVLEAGRTVSLLPGAEMAVMLLPVLFLHPDPMYAVKTSTTQSNQVTLTRHKAAKHAAYIQMKQWRVEGI